MPELIRLITLAFFLATTFQSLAQIPATNTTTTTSTAPRAAINPATSSSRPALTISPCNQTCPTDRNPVCGTDGVTYCNDCTLQTANCNRTSDRQITVNYRGSCRSGRTRPFRLRLPND